MITLALMDPAPDIVMHAIWHAWVAKRSLACWPAGSLECLPGHLYTGTPVIPLLNQHIAAVPHRTIYLDYWLPWP